MQSALKCELSKKELVIVNLSDIVEDFERTQGAADDQRHGECEDPLKDRTDNIMGNVLKNVVFEKVQKTKAIVSRSRSLCKAGLSPLHEQRLKPKFNVKF